MHQLFSRTNGASSVEEAEISLFISTNCKELKRINIIKSEFQLESRKEILSPLFIFSSLFPEIALNHGFQPPTHSYFFSYYFSVKTELEISNTPEKLWLWGIFDQFAWELWRTNKTE